MNELDKILEGSVLSDEVKAKLKEAFENQVKTQVADREVSLAESAEQHKKDLAQAAIEMIEEAVSEEFKAIQDEIVEARSLDVRYAVKLEEFKEQYAAAKEKDIQEAIDQVVGEELGELKESLIEARKNLAGQRMFEAFQNTYSELAEGSDVDATEMKESLAKALKENEELRFEKKVNELLEGVTGRKRSVMSTLLEGTPYDKLEARFEDLSKNVLLKEESEEEDKGEDLKESASEESGEDLPKDGTAVFESDADDKEAEQSQKDWLKRARRMAGLN